MPASPTAGYSLCCSVYKWQPVNLFTARQGVNLAMGLPHRERWGTLVRPVEVRADGVVWLLDLREPERPEARQVPFLFGPCTGKLLLLEGMDPNPELWAEPVWVSSDGWWQGPECVGYAPIGVHTPRAWGMGLWGRGGHWAAHYIMVWRLACWGAHW